MTAARRAPARPSRGGPPFDVPPSSRDGWEIVGVWHDDKQAHALMAARFPAPEWDVKIAHCTYSQWSGYVRPATESTQEDA